MKVSEFGLDQGWTIFLVPGPFFLIFGHQGPHFKKKQELKVTFFYIKHKDFDKKTSSPGQTKEFGGPYFALPWVRCHPLPKIFDFNLKKVKVRKMFFFSNLWQQMTQFLESVKRCLTCRLEIKILKKKIRNWKRKIRQFARSYKLSFQIRVRRCHCQD